MKNIGLINKIVALVSCFVLLLGCKQTWDDHYNRSDSQMTVLSLLKQNPNCAYFAKLLEDYDMEDLAEYGTVTILVPPTGSIELPTNDQYLARKILRQHIISGKLTATNAAGRHFKASNGGVVLFSDDFTFANGISIVENSQQIGNGVVYQIAAPISLSDKGLYDYLKANKDEYSYIYNLYSAPAFDEQASIKLVQNGVESYDSVFTASCPILDSYTSNNQFYTAILFDDKSFDNALDVVNPAIKSAVEANGNVKEGLIAATFLQNIYQGNRPLPTVSQKWVSVNESEQLITSNKIDAIGMMQNYSVYTYNDLSTNLGLSYFNILIQADEWTWRANGGGSSNANMSVPLVNKGNGMARRDFGNSAHAYYKIGGTYKGSYLPVLNAVTYKIRLGVHLNKVFRTKLLVYGASSDVLLSIANHPNFDSNGYFVNETLNGGFKELEFGPMVLYTKNEGTTPTFKLHVDYRNLQNTFPTVEGQAPTSDQLGIVIDYIEFEPVFN